MSLFNRHYRKDSGEKAGTKDTRGKEAFDREELVETLSGDVEILAGSRGRSWKTCRIRVDELRRALATTQAHPVDPDPAVR